MKALARRLVPTLVLALALLAAPAGAQLGPAGVPGIFDLTESLLAPDESPAPAPTHLAPVKTPAVAQKTAPCATADKSARCRNDRELRRKVKAGCQGKAGAQRQQCLRTQTTIQSCEVSEEPQLCRAFEKARTLCRGKEGESHRQCLRETLAPAK